MPKGPRALAFAADDSAEQAGVPLSLSDALPGGAGGHAAGEVKRRSYVDPNDGSRWTVVERSPSGGAGDAGERSLYFVGDGVFRRVRSYPAGWRDLSDAELATLSRAR